MLLFFGKRLLLTRTQLENSRNRRRLAFARKMQFRCRFSIIRLKLVRLLGSRIRKMLRLTFLVMVRRVIVPRKRGIRFFCRNLPIILFRITLNGRGFILWNFSLVKQSLVPLLLRVTIVLWILVLKGWRGPLFLQWNLFSKMRKCWTLEWYRLTKRVLPRMTWIIGRVREFLLLLLLFRIRMLEYRFWNSLGYDYGTLVFDRSLECLENTLGSCWSFSRGGG